MRPEHVAGLLVNERIAEADYNRLFGEATVELRAAELELTRPTEVEQSLRQLVDVGGMVSLMTPDIQKRNIHRIFVSIELGDDCQIVGARIKDWVKRAFAAVDEVLNGPKHAEGGNRTHTP